jgi:hypothetical protein
MNRRQQREQRGGAAAGRGDQRREQEATERRICENSGIIDISSSVSSVTSCSSAGLGSETGVSKPSE